MIKSRLHTAHVGECSPPAENLELKTQGLYSRKELYDMAWQQPMTVLTSVIGVSPTLISEACQSHNIPVPPPGYWSKVRAGKRVTQPLLPSRPAGMSKFVQIGRPRCLRDVLRSYDLDTYLPSIDELRAQWTHATAEVLYKRPTKWPRKYDRQSAIWQFLLEVISKLCTVKAENQHNGSRWLRIYNQTVFIQMMELEPQSIDDERIADKQCKSLALSISMAAETQEVWIKYEDADSKPLEEKLPEIVVELLLCAEVKQRHTESRRHEWLLAQQAEHRAKLDDEKRNKKQSVAKQDAERLSILLAQAKDLEHANTLRQLLAKVEKAYPHHFDAQVRIWREFVASEIIKLDPLTDKRFLNVLDLPPSGDDQASQAA